MAVEETTPHGLKKYTAGTDPIPGRAGHNLMIDKINQMPGLGIGPLSSRPAPSSGLRFWVEESTRRLSVNIGTEWVGIANLGGVLASPIEIAGIAYEGTSDRAARADHVHPLPLATSESHGAMSAADKQKLDETNDASKLNKGKVRATLLPGATDYEPGALHHSHYRVVKNLPLLAPSQTKWEIYSLQLRTTCRIIRSWAAVGNVWKATVSGSGGIIDKYAFFGGTLLTNLGPSIISTRAYIDPTYGKCMDIFSVVADPAPGVTEVEVSFFGAW